MQDCCNSSALAMELLQSFTEPSITYLPANNCHILPNAIGQQLYSIKQSGPLLNYVSLQIGQGLMHLTSWRWFLCEHGKLFSWLPSGKWLYALNKIVWSDFFFNQFLTDASHASTNFIISYISISGESLIFSVCFVYMESCLIVSHNVGMAYFAMYHHKLMGLLCYWMLLEKHIYYCYRFLN